MVLCFTIPLQRENFMHKSSQNLFTSLAYFDNSLKRRRPETLMMTRSPCYICNIFSYFLCLCLFLHEYCLLCALSLKCYLKFPLHNFNEINIFRSYSEILAWETQEKFIFALANKHKIFFGYIYIYLHQLSIFSNISYEIWLCFIWLWKIVPWSH